MNTKLSININKFALIRNARDENMPNINVIAQQCINYGIQGITVHPRPDERHVKYSDLQPLRKLTLENNEIEFNIEGYPSDIFLNHVYNVKPDQLTLVPDPPEALTSSFGWDLEQHRSFLIDICNDCRKRGIRSSLFISPDIKGLELLNEIKPDRVELYTYDYAHQYSGNKVTAIEPFKTVVRFLNENCNVEINAGHDLNQDNLAFLLKELECIKEVSIGHALVCDAIQDGLEKTVKSYVSLCR
jgi:pyridoxine 5-phosphate synthase